MEEKKIMTAVLLIAVILIWSTIIFKVTRRGRPAEARMVEAPLEKLAAEERKDSLRLDYRDPFIGEFVRVKRDEKNLPPKAGTARKEPERLLVPDFTFKGLIGNGSGQRAMILKNESLYVVGLGERVGDFKVVGISQEYMVVRCGENDIEVKVR